MQVIDDFSDSRLKSWCIHCGGWRVNLDCNVDHVPSKSFLLDPRPDNLPTVPVCKTCNSSFSRDEAYMVAFLSATMSGTTDPTKQTIPSARRILEKSQALQVAINRTSSYSTIGGEQRMVWKPDMERIERVVVKNARGHAFFEIGEPMMQKPTRVRVVPLEYMKDAERDGFESGYDPQGMWPEVGSRMMTRLLTGQDLNSDGWVIVQDGVYRYLAIQAGLMTVRTVLHDFLATEVYWGDDF